MKLLRVSGMHYAAAKTAPYLSAPHLIRLPYSEQLKAVLSHFFHYGDSLTVELSRFEYDCSEVVFDLEILQKKWAEENRCAFSEETWASDILIHQIRSIRPDILLLHNLQTPVFSLLKEKKHLFPFLKCLVIFRGYPEADRSLLQYLSLADVLLVGSPILENVCSAHGMKPQLFHHYFDSRILSHIDDTPPTYPCTFLGSSGLGFDWVHQPRYFYLHELLKEKQIECWLEEASGVVHSWKQPIKRVLEWFLGVFPDSLLQKARETPSLHPHLQKLAFNALARKSSLRNGYSLFPNSPLRSLFPDRCHPPIFGIEMYRMLARSKVTFNIHSFAASGTADNIRLFQAPGVGSCLVTDFGTNLGDLFEIDREVAAYSSLAECKEKINFLLQNEKTRAAIASKGKERIFKDHTAANRAAQLHGSLQNWFRTGK